jgi:hypothetical protein
MAAIHLNIYLGIYRAPDVCCAARLRRIGGLRGNRDVIGSATCYGGRKSERSVCIDRQGLGPVILQHEAAAGIGKIDYSDTDAVSGERSRGRAAGGARAENGSCYQQNNDGQGYRHGFHIAKFFLGPISG